MEQKISEIIDRYTILRIKQAHGLDCVRELKKYSKVIDRIDVKLLNELYLVNLSIWDLESEIGKLALQVRKWNNKRNKIKNEIAGKFREWQDKKIYYTKK